jgi:hypothetical protein
MMTPASTPGSPASPAGKCSGGRFSETPLRPASRTSSGTPQVAGDAREKPPGKTCPVRIPGWVPYTGPRAGAFGFFRSARRKGPLQHLSLPMARDGQQPDRACGPSAVDACGRQSQGARVQNGLDLSGSAGDRRGSPGRSERRIRAPLSRRRPLHVVEVPPMSSVSSYSARLLARLRSCRPSGRVTRPAHRRAGRFYPGSQASAPPSSLLPDPPWQPGRHLPLDESSGRTCRAPLRRAGSGSV